MSRDRGQGESAPSVSGPPCSVEAERAVIGSVMSEGGPLLTALLPLLNEDDFFVPATGALWGLIRQAYNTGQPTDPVSVIELARNAAFGADRGNVLEAIGGAGAVAEMLDMGMPGSAVHHARIVREKADRRRGIELAERLKRAFSNQAEPWLAGCEDVESALMALRRTHSRKGLRSGHDVVMDVVNTMDARYRRRGQPQGLCLGFADIDRTINGLQREDLMVVAARPAMGKTALATAFAEAVSLDASNRANRPVLMFTLEMSDAQIMERSVLGRARVALSKGRAGMFSEAEGCVWKVAAKVMAECRGGDIAGGIYGAAAGALEERWKAKGTVPTTQKIEAAGHEIVALASALQAVSAGSLSFYDGYGVTTQEVRSQIRSWVRSIKWDRECADPSPPLVIIDYLQLVKASEKKAKGDPRLAVVEVMDALKGIAKDLGLVVMVLAQVGRGAEENTGKIPMLKDLKESGAIEEYADYVAFLHRDSYYKQWAKLGESDRKAWDGMAIGRNKSADAEEMGEPAWTGETFYNAHAVFSLKKARHAACGDIDILFFPERAKFGSKTAKLFSNNEARRQQHVKHEPQELL